MLGALTSRWLRTVGAASPSRTNSRTNSDPALDPTFRRLFLSGEVRYLNAYPGDANNRPMLPIPQSLVFPKREHPENCGVIDRATGVDLPEDESWQELSAGSRSGCFLRWRGESIELHQVPIVRQMHNTVDRTSGQVRDGELYNFRVIAAGSRFIGAIILDHPEDEAVMLELLGSPPAPLSLGRSRASEYGGQASLDVLERSSSWLEVDPAVQGESPAYSVATLLSDYCGHDAHGCRTVDAFQEDLEAAIGQRLVLHKKYVRRSIRRGYVAAWRMSRAPEPVLEAGSVLVFQPVDVMVGFRVLSLGDRQAEGFGRVALNWHGVEMPDLKTSPLSVPIPRTPSPTSTDPLRRRLRQQWLIEQILPRVNTAIRFENGHGLTTSGLSNLRQALLDPNFGDTVREAKPNEFRAMLRERLGDKTSDALMTCRLRVMGMTPERMTLVKFLEQLWIKKISSKGSMSPEAFAEMFLVPASIKRDVSLYLREVSLEHRELHIVVERLRFALLDHLRRIIQLEPTT